MLPRVFDMFVQERQALDRSQGGLGLGLTIVRSLIALHGGRVEVASDGPGRGSEFAIRLPAAIPAATAEPAGNGHHLVDARTGHRILVVDDNEDAASLLAECLDAMGNTTRVAFDGPAALRIAEEFAPDVALLDIGLPVMDGYELARRLREQPGHESIRLVAVTGYGLDSDRRRSQQASFDAHLVKPVTVDRLERVIRDLCR
jgi:CheY-like chemotaxis protein